MDDTLALIADHTASLAQAWHRGDLAGARELGRQVGEWAGLQSPPSLWRRRMGSN